MAVKIKEEQKVSQDIKCPHCGMDYKPYDIFYPQDDYLGKADYERDYKGSIIEEFWKKAPTTEETYVCDGCHRAFITSIEMKFITRPADNTFSIKKDVTFKLQLDL